MTKTTTIRIATAATLNGLLEAARKGIEEGFKKLESGRLYGAAAAAVERKLERLIAEEERLGAQLREQLAFEEAKLASIEEAKLAKEAEEEAARAALSEAQEAEELALGESFGSAVAQAIASPSSALMLLIGSGDEDAGMALIRTWEQVNETLKERDEACVATRAALNDAINSRDALVRAARGRKASIRRKRQGRIDAAGAQVDSAKEAWIDSVVARCLADAEVEQLRAAGIEQALEELAHQRHEEAIAMAADRLEEMYHTALGELAEVTRLSRSYRVLASRLDAEAFKTRDIAKLRKLRADQHAAEFRARLTLNRRSALLDELNEMRDEVAVVLGHSEHLRFAASLDEDASEELEFIESYEAFARDMTLSIEQQLAQIQRRISSSRGRHSLRGTRRTRTHRADRRSKETVEHEERGLTFVA